MEKLRRLDKIDTCLVCGATKFSRSLERDHMLPKSMARKPETIKVLNPFWDVVFQRANVFRVCHYDHVAIDAEKTAAFSQDGFQTLNPVGLLKFLMEKYPITTIQRFQNLQLREIILTLSKFSDVAHNLNGELPKSLAAGYREAARLADIFIERLEGEKVQVAVDFTAPRLV